MPARAAIRAAATLLASAALVVIVAAPARAADVRLGGHVKGFVFQQLGDPWLLDRAGSRLQLSLAGGGDAVAFFGAIDLEIDSRLGTRGLGETRSASLDLWPVEMWIRYLGESIELTVGQQFIFWGRSVWEPPTDVLSGWDYANMASEIEDYRLAPVAARFDWFLGHELMLQLVWLPVFQASRVPIEAPATMGPLPVIETAPLVPERRPWTGELGLRLSQSVSRWAFDWAVAAYKGYEKTPMVQVVPRIPDDAVPPAPDALLWTERYDPLWMVGLDFAKALGPFVLIGEAALKGTDDWESADIFVRDSRIEAVLGASWVASQELDLTLQYQATQLIHYDRSATEAQLTAAMGAPPDFVEQPLSHELALRLSYKLLTNVGLQVLVLGNATYRDLFGMAFVWWDVADGLKAYLGAVGFGGLDPASPFGRQASNSRGFLELKYSF